MAGSVLRLTILAVFSTLPNYSVLQQPESWIQNPFRLKTSFLKDFMQVREELFPFSFTAQPQSGEEIRRSPLINIVGSLLRTQQHPEDATSNSVVKRKAIIENPKVQNYIREKIKETPRGNSSNERKEYLNKLLNFHFGTNNENYTESETSGPETVFTNKPLVYHDSSVSSETTAQVSNNRRVVGSPQGHSPNDVSPYYHSQLNEITKDLPIIIENDPPIVTKDPLVVTKDQPIETNDPPIVTKDPPIVTKDSPIIQVERIKAPFNKEPVGDTSKISFLGYVISTLTQLPIIGNVLRASVDPLYRPILKTLQPAEAERENVMSGEMDMKNWCFGVLGCIAPTIDFFHPLYRPVNLPPYPREQIDTHFSFHSREDAKGTVVSAMKIEEVNETTFSSDRRTVFIIHGYLNDRLETWVWEMVRGLLKQGDYNVITVDWSSGAYALYSQATANIRVVSLEIVRLVKWLQTNYNLDPSDVHIIGHSLGAHTAGYVGERISKIGRITGLDPAEPFFQYMPSIVRLDPTDATFVDVIHTDIDSFFAITGPRGFGLEQAVGHIDFYPNGGKEQPGCNQLLSTLPMTLMSEGEGLVEGINAAQKELVNCDHIRAPKLFTDSIVSGCPYLAFECSSYKTYKEGKCFQCGSNGDKCASMGMFADQWKPHNKSLVTMFLDTHVSPNFCKYHYLLTINFSDPEMSVGTLRGRLKVSLITEDGNLKKFDLTTLSPLKFPRRGSRTFMLEHHEDLGGAQEALLNWTFESDLLNPMTFCVLFCKADLSVTTVTLTSIDTQNAARKVSRMRLDGLKFQEDAIFNGGEIIMCHKKAEGVVTIPSDSTVKIAASPICKNLVGTEAPSSLPESSSDTSSTSSESQLTTEINPNPLTSDSKVTSTIVSRPLTPESEVTTFTESRPSKQESDALELLTQQSSSNDQPTLMESRLTRRQLRKLRRRLLNRRL